jgi:predicted enzyme related to lactoylglutathione lyase
MTQPSIKIGMIIIMVPNVDEAVEFYKKIGFPIHFHLKDQWAELGAGNARIGICPGSGDFPERHTGVVFETNDVQSCYNAMKEQGVTFLKDPFTAVHGVMASFKDTGNNIFDLYQPTPEKVHEVAEKVKNEGGSCADKSSSCNDFAC